MKRPCPDKLHLAVAFYLKLFRNTSQIGSYKFNKAAVHLVSILLAHTFIHSATRNKIKTAALKKYIENVKRDGKIQKFLLVKRVFYTRIFLKPFFNSKIEI